MNRTKSEVGKRTVVAPNRRMLKSQRAEERKPKPSLYKLWVGLLVITAGLLTWMFFTNTGQTVELRFNSGEQINQYDGQKVMIVGYVSTVVAPEGDLIYLVNTPFNDRPFEARHAVLWGLTEEDWNSAGYTPETESEYFEFHPSVVGRIFDTIAIYPKAGSQFLYYEGLVRVIGTLVVENIQDGWGFRYDHRIENATWEQLPLKDVPPNIQRYMRLAEANVFIPALNGMDSIIGALSLTSMSEDLRLVPKSSWQQLIEVTKESGVAADDYIFALTELMNMSEIINGNVLTGDFDANLEDSFLDELDAVVGRFVEWFWQFKID